MDIDGFASTKWETRTDFVHVPPMAPYFKSELQAELDKFEAEHGREPDDDEAEVIGRRTVGFRVRGLSGPEMGVARQKAAKRKNIPEIIEELFSETPKSIRSAVAAVYATDAELSTEDAENLYIAARAIVWPDVPDDERLRVASTLHRNFSEYFRKLAYVVRLLTGQGAEPGKPAPSSESPA